MILTPKKHTFNQQIIEVAKPQL